MYKQYSFLDESLYLEESWWKSALAGGLALAGTVGLSGVKMPQAYMRANPGARATFGGEVVRKIVYPSGPKVDYGKEFMRGFNYAKSKAPMTKFQKLQKIGNNLTNVVSQKSSVTNALGQAATLGKDLAKSGVIQ